jgi:hypothetical protein
MLGLSGCTEIEADPRTGNGGRSTCRGPANLTNIRPQTRGGAAGRSPGALEIWPHEPVREQERDQGQIEILLSRQHFRRKREVDRATNGDEVDQSVDANPG